MNDWENYWNNVQLTGKEGQVFWDSVSEKAFLEDLLRFKNYLDLSLPIIDLGCGNGRQSRFLAKHFEKVIGVDVSESAIRLANLETVDEDNIEYRVFDAVNTEDARALHDGYGDMNIYMRGVLHMIKRRDRRQFINNLELLLGNQGILYQLELPSEAILYLRTLPEDIFSQIPKITRRIGFNFEERALYYPDEKWKVLDQGQNVTISTVPLVNGKEGAVPANFLILKPRTSDHGQQGDQ